MATLRDLAASLFLLGFAGLFYHNSRYGELPGLLVSLAAWGCSVGLGVYLPIKAREVWQVEKGRQQRYLEGVEI